MQTRKRQLFILAAAALVSACIEKEQPKPAEPPPGPPPEPARSALSVDVNAAYTIVGVGSNKCLQFAAAVRTMARRPRSRRATSRRRSSSSCAASRVLYTNRSAASEKCLDVQGSSMDDGATLSQYGCHDGVNQQWILADADPGTLRIVARNSGKVLDVRGEHTEDGTPVNDTAGNRAPTRSSSWRWRSTTWLRPRRRRTGQGARAARRAKPVRPARPARSPTQRLPM